MMGHNSRQGYQQPAQEIVKLFEYPLLPQGDSRQPVQAYDNTELSAKPSNLIGTVNIGTPLMLTGVLREASENNPIIAVQVYLPGRRLSVHQPMG
jgi:hypothetical protein